MVVLQDSWVIPYGTYKAIGLMRDFEIDFEISYHTDKPEVEIIMHRYFQDVKRYPGVSVEEEEELCIRIRKGDNDATEKLITANLRFVISVAIQYQGYGLSLPDLISEGNLGLVNAARKFDDTKGFKFISYAVWWVRQAIIRALEENARIVRLPMNRVMAIRKITNATALLEQKYEREPAETEIAEYLGIDPQEVEFANQLKEPQVSLDQPVVVRNEELSLYDVIQTENIPPPDSRMIKESLNKNIRMALNSFSGQEAAFITLAYGLGNSIPYELTDIAYMFDLSCERVSRIIKNGIHKLKRYSKIHPSLLATD